MRRSASPRSQSGALVAVLVLVCTFAVLAWFSPRLLEHGSTARLVRTDRALAQARIALLDYLDLANDRDPKQPSSRPGELPCPDRGTVAEDGALDGIQDMPCARHPRRKQEARTRVGQLPWRFGRGCKQHAYRNGLGMDLRDGDGNRLWYAVSHNVVSNLQYGTFNPATRYKAPFDWLRVYDAGTEKFIERVAAVVISPGRPLKGQRRVGSALDEMCLPTRSRRVSDYLELDVGVPRPAFPALHEKPDTPASAFLHANAQLNFNDRLTYIHADDVLRAASRFANATVRAALRQYWQRYDRLPYAADPSGSATCEMGRTAGALPLPACIRTVRAVVCRLPGVVRFKAAPSVKKRIKDKPVLLPQKFSKASGSCVYTATHCVCWGIGECTGGDGRHAAHAHFNCIAPGLCVTGAVGDADFRTAIDPHAAAIALVSPTENSLPEKDVWHCVMGLPYPTPRTCYRPMGCKQPERLNLPDWFFENRWDRFLAYGVSKACVVPEQCRPVPDQARVVSLAPQENESDALLAAWPHIAPVDEDGLIRTRRSDPAMRWRDEGFAVWP